MAQRVMNSCFASVLHYSLLLAAIDAARRKSLLRSDQGRMGQ